MKKAFSKVSALVKIMSMTKVGFNENGSMVMLDFGMESISAAMVPATVESFVSTFHPFHAITRIEKTTVGYEVTLSNHLTVKVGDLQKAA